MSMSGYTKLFNSILASTIWRSSDTTRIVWITLLAMSDKDGVCEGSIPGLADFARVSIEDCEAALAELIAPDPYSRTSEHEGRRVEVIDGVGWQLLNHAKYRMKMSEDERREYNRQKQAEWRARQKELEASKDVNECQEPSITVNDGQSQSAVSAHTDTEADTEAELREETPQAASPRKKGTRVPHPFLLTPEMKAWAAERKPGVDAVLETEKFVNHFRSASGRNATKLDWRLTWNNWILNSKGETNGTNRQNGKRTDADVFAESADFYANYPDPA